MITAFFALLLGCLPVAADEVQSFEVRSPLRLQAGGYLRVNYSAQKSSADTFNIKFARLKLVGTHPDFPGWKLAFLYDMASATGLRDAYLEYSTPALWGERLRLVAATGQIKPPFGRAHLRYPPDFDLLELPVAVRGLNPGRDIGVVGWDIGAKGEAHLDALGSKDLVVGQIGAFNGEGANTADKNSQKNVVARLLLNPLPALSVAGSWAQGSTSTLRNFYQRFGWDVRLNLGPAALTYEQLYGRTGSVQGKGQYLLGTIWALSKLKAGIAYGWLDPKLGADGDRTYETTFSLNMYPHRLLRVAVEHTLIREQGNQVYNDLTQLAVICQF